VHRPALLHVPAAQSRAVRQLWQRAHGAHEPPQSTSVSVPLRTRSVQLGAWHTPPTHTPLEHTLPHAPQLVALVVRSVSQPLAALASQSPRPGVQAYPQRPDAQVGEAPATLGQAVPHVPQLVSVVRRSVSQPLAALTSQSPKPIAHAVRAQAPMTQLDDACGSEHTRPHAPQFEALVRTSTSHPLADAPSQSV